MFDLFVGKSISNTIAWLCPKYNLLVQVHLLSCTRLCAHRCLIYLRLYCCTPYQIISITPCQILRPTPLFPFFSFPNPIESVKLCLIYFAEEDVQCYLNGIILICFVCISKGVIFKLINKLLSNWLRKDKLRGQLFPHQLCRGNYKDGYLCGNWVNNCSIFQVENHLLINIYSNLSHKMIPTMRRIYILNRTRLLNAP